jgi:PAS domain S-box-containing protein
MPIRYPAIKISHKNGEHDAHGQPETGQVIARDVTEHKMAEEALQVEKNKMQFVVDAMMDALTMISRDYEIVFQNQRARQNRGEHLGEKCYQAYSHTDKVCAGCPVALAFQDGQPHTIEKKRLEPSGLTTCWENTASPVKDAGGKVVICLEIDHEITHRKQAEKALQESQKFVSSLLENAPNATLVVNPDTSVRYVNPAWERLNGWALTEVIGLKAPYYPWWTKETQTEEFLPVFVKAIHQPVGRAEIEAVKKNGEPFWVDMNWVSVTQDGEFQYVIINSVDITERKKAEEKRQAILQTAIDGFWICDLNGKFLEVNDAYCAMTGYTREELLKMSIKDVEAIEMPEKTAERIKRIIEKGSDLFETQHKCKDGRTADFEISVKYHNIGEGQLTVFVRDITDRKKAQKALGESEEKFSKAFQVSPVMIAITAAKDGKFIEVNDTYTLRTGYSKEELIGNTATEMQMWAHIEDRARMLKILKVQGRVNNLEIAFRMKSGETRIWLFSAEPIDISGELCLIGASVDITERKLMEESLANEAIRRRILIEQSRDGIVILDHNGGVFEANRRFAEMLGYTPKEVMGLHVWDWEYLYPPEQVLEMIRTVDEAGDHFETQHRRKDGSIFNVEISTNGAIFSGQKLIFCVCRDITERKQAEVKRQAIIQTALDGFCSTNLEGKILEVNDSYCAMTGYTREELLKMSITEIDVTSSPEYLDKLAKDVVELGYARLETKHRRKDGRLIDIEISSKYSNTGETQVYSFIRDITERKEVEARLKAQKQLIEGILSNMLEAVLVVDSSDRVILANESARRIFRRSNRAMQNKPLKDVIPAESLLKLYNDVKLDKARDNTLEFRHQVNNIDKIIVCGAVRMDEGRTLLTFTDVSREREEKEKLYLTDRLASIGEMAVGLAHELNNPLTGIMSLSQMLTESEMPAEAQEDLKCINSEARRAANIVKNVLLFTRNNNYENGQASVNEVVKDVLRLREYEEKANNISVVTNLQDNLPDVLIDRFQMQQVVLNIILNAEAAIKEVKHPGLLTVTTEKVNHIVNIHFTDNGCGIKKNVLPRIFDPFFTTKEIGKGTGLGLSICFGIVTQHRGKISVKTQVNKGTTFTVRMPASRKKT